MKRDYFNKEVIYDEELKMSYMIKREILGFETINEVVINEIDELFSTMQDKDNKNVSFTMVHPYPLREYSFDLPSDVKVLLDVHEKSNVSVYNIVVVQKPLEESTINFLAPIVVNHDNNTIAQVVLNTKRHPGFGLCETIKTYLK